MKVLVTGGAGFIGSHVADELLQEGHKVAALDNLSTGKLHNIPIGVEFFRGDICSRSAKPEWTKFQPEVIIHHAAQMDARRSILEPQFDARNNIEGTVNMLEWGRKIGVRKFIFASTGGPLYGIPLYQPYDEDHPVYPICQYGLSKHVGEQYCQLYADLYGMEWVAFRYPNMYGPRQNPDGEAGVVAIFAGTMSLNQPVTIYGDGEQTRDFVHVWDIACANVLALNKGSGIYCLGSGIGTRVNTLYKWLAELTGYTLQPQFEPARVGEVHITALSGKKAAAELGWQSKVELYQGLNTVLESLRGCVR